MFFHIVSQMKKELAQLDTWLEKAEADAKARSFDPVVFVGMRLAPDQFPLSRQIQSACDNAKFTAARLAGKEAPSHADTEQTVAELRARVQTVVKYLDGFTAKDFDGTPTRVITQARWEGKTMTSADYLVEYAIPNFFFHLTHAYAILRHNGVNLGKKDFLGAITMHGG